tara:strand:- start:404 stop:625 length:222 start_codon:yes stop_codon:yes gene_type:complete
MAKSIKQLKEGPVRTLLQDMWDDPEAKKLVQSEVLSGPSAMTYLLAYKVSQQQAQINDLTKKLDQVLTGVNNG